MFTFEDKNNLPVHQPLLSDNVECLTNTVYNAGYDCITKIKKLKDNRSPEIDGITPELLKEIAEEITVPLAIMFNLSLREGTVPHEWKHANVVPIFKKGNGYKAENYRPYWQKCDQRAAISGRTSSRWQHDLHAQFIDQTRCTAS